MQVQPEQSRFWLDRIAADIVKQNPTGEIIISSGVSPSGPYHIGHLREVLSADALLGAIERLGRTGKHLHFVDDFDILRKIPAGLEKKLTSEMGKPLYLASDPYDCHTSYSAHFFEEFWQTVSQLIGECEVVYSHKQYQQGEFTAKIAQSLAGLDKIKQIVAEVSGRQIGEDWAPVQLLSDNNLLDEWSFVDWDKSSQVILYTDRAGKEGELDYSKGRVKLDWRLDWPARWSIWDVMVEPFGRDHATKGGSYDTGEKLAKEIFGCVPPYPVPYEFINLVGNTKKMSASLGTGISPKDAFDIMPPEILRYFVLRSKPSRTLIFDPGMGLYNLIEEFTKVGVAVASGEEHEFAEAYKASSIGSELTISSIPFTHLVSAYQTARGDAKGAGQILSRTGYLDQVKEQAEVIERELGYVKNWLEKYAPEEVKFELQKILPKIELSDAQKQFLSLLADELESESDLSAQAIHDVIYAVSERAQLVPSEGFTAIYRVVLGKKFGPKAGWFLASLDQPWLIARLRLQK